MKKLILAAFAVTCAVGVFAQGTVAFDMRFGTTTHIWGPSSTKAGLSLIGFGTNDNPVGTVNYAAAGMTMIGGVGGLSASTTFAQLLAGPAGTPEGSLIPQTGSITTFRTGGAQGNIAAKSVTLNGVAADATTAVFEVVAWDNSSGKYANWTQAAAAFEGGLIAAGKGGIFSLANIGGSLNTPPTTILPASFNLYIIPEPSTFALAGLGVAALLAFRRRN